MAHGLPNMVHSDGITKSVQTLFGGYNHTLAAGDGELYDMQNITSDYYPILSPRKPRYKIKTLSKPNGIFGNDGLYYVDGTGFYADGILKGSVTDSKKRFAACGAYIVIFPDKKYYNRNTGEFGSLEASWNGAAAIMNGTYAGETAAANTIRVAYDLTALFKAGDGITIEGCTKHPENNKTIVVREIQYTAGYTYLRFYENSFTIATAGDSETAIKLSRKVPDMDYICANENRLWGCKGDEIFCSKLGDIFNFAVFDGIATDSWSTPVLSSGDFTGCTAYLGYPLFFKQDMIYKVYGSKASDFQVLASASLGVDEGSDKSLAIAGETLFYLSRVGIVAYTGGIPQNVSAPFGMERYKNAVGGSDGVKYYVSMEDTYGAFHLFVYDTRINLWHKEDNFCALGLAWEKNLWYLENNGTIWAEGNSRNITGTQESAVSSIAEFGDFIEGSPNKKGLSKLQLRLSADEGASITVQIKFDSEDAWQDVHTLVAERKRSYYLPIIPRRNDHYRVRIIGIGEWKLYSMSREYYYGSEM